MVSTCISLTNISFCDWPWEKKMMGFGDLGVFFFLVWWVVWWGGRVVFGRGGVQENCLILGWLKPKSWMIMGKIMEK